MATLALFLAVVYASKVSAAPPETPGGNVSPFKSMEPPSNSVAVLEFAGDGENTKRGVRLAAELRQVLAAEYAVRYTFAVKQPSAAASVQESCAEVQCAAEYGRTQGVAYVVFGRIRQQESGGWVATATVVESGSGAIQTVEWVARATLEGNERDAAKELASRIALSFGARINQARLDRLQSAHPPRKHQLRALYDDFQLTLLMADQSAETIHARLAAFEYDRHLLQALWVRARYRTGRIQSVAQEPPGPDQGPGVTITDPANLTADGRLHGFGIGPTAMVLFDCCVLMAGGMIEYIRAEYSFADPVLASGKVVHENMAATFVEMGAGAGWRVTRNCDLAVRLGLGVVGIVGGSRTNRYESAGLSMSPIDDYVSYEFGCRW